MPAFIFMSRSSFHLFLFVCFYCLFCVFILPFIQHFNFPFFISLTLQITHYTWFSLFIIFIPIIYFLSYYYYSKTHTAPFPDLNLFCHLPEFYYCWCKLFFLSHYSKFISLTLIISLYPTSHKHSFISLFNIFS